MNREQALEAALRACLPHVERLAAAAPTTPTRSQRQQAAAAAAAATQARDALTRPADRRPALERVAVLAGALAIETPRKPGQYSHSAYVPWRLILDLRQALTAAGYDLEKARAVYEETKRQARAKGDAP